MKKGENKTICVLRWVTLPFAVLIIPAFAVFLVTTTGISKFIPSCLVLPIAAFLHGMTFSGVATMCAPSHKRVVQIVACVAIFLWTLVALSTRKFEPIIYLFGALDVVGCIVYPIIKRAAKE